jgi:hypothetical protein
VTAPNDEPTDAMTTPADPNDPRHALGQSVGFAAFVWGYPLVESVRTCRLQTTPVATGTSVAWHAPIDRLQHVRSVATDADRDVVTPANDLLYTTGWIDLAKGPRLLHAPASARHPGRYFVLALYDAWTVNFENPGLRTSPAQGETVLLVGPGTPADATTAPADATSALVDSTTAPAAAASATAPGVRVVRSPTDLVWLIARVVAGAGDDVSAARALQSEIRLECPHGTDSGRPPACVDRWLGPADEDTIAALRARPHEKEAIAGAFFTNLCRSLADYPPPAADAGLAHWFARAGLVAAAAFDFAQVAAPTRAGLLQGLTQAAAWIESGSRSRRARPWATHFALGRYGTEYTTRALTAYKGLGALVPEEAVYAMGDFDADGQPLDGRRAYVLRFEPGELPPVDAFWSVTLYDADRFLYANALGRHSIGDRTAGLVRDADGGLSLQIGHARPPHAANWLPAPAGAFYLILRMYAPRPEVRTWPIPPLRKMGQ